VYDNSLYMYMHAFTTKILRGILVVLHLRKGGAAPLNKNVHYLHQYIFFRVMKKIKDFHIQHLYNACFFSFTTENITTGHLRYTQY